MRKRGKTAKERAEARKPQYKKGYRSMQGFVIQPLGKKEAVSTFTYSKSECRLKAEERLQGFTLEEAGYHVARCQIILRVFEPKENE